MRIRTGDRAVKTISFDDALDISLTERQLRLATGRQSRSYTRKEVEQSMLEVFDLIGGVPRLAIWANNPENYGEFMKLIAKLLPKEGAREEGNVINFVSSIPDSPLNEPKPDEMPTIEHDDGGMSEDLQ